MKFIKIDGCDLYENEVKNAYENGLYLVHYRTVTQICYSEAQRKYYGLTVYKKPAQGVPIVLRGRYVFAPASRVNDWIGSDILA